MQTYIYFYYIRSNILEKGKKNEKSQIHGKSKKKKKKKKKKKRKMSNSRKK